MKDRAGNELVIGDRVLYTTPGTSTSWLRWGSVVGFTPKMVRIKDESDSLSTETLLFETPGV